MRGFFDKLNQALSGLDGLEFVIPAVLAAVLLIFGPTLASVYLIRKHHYIAAVLSGSIWALAAIACVRDLRRRQFRWVSISLIVIWIVTTLVILWKLEAG
jgi:membrane associated rhomboid family serine protease